MTMLPPDTPSLRGAVDLSSLVNRPARESSSQPHDHDGSSSQPVSVPALVLEGTDTNFTQFLELSMTVPVIVDLWAEWCQPCKQLTPVLKKLIGEYAGALVLVTVDVDSNPQLSQAFQAQSIPTVAAIVGGRPVSLFAGAYPEQQVREVFEQVLQLAASSQVTGTAVAPESGEPASDEEAVSVEEPLPPHHQEAHDAIERGDYSSAIAEFTLAIAQNPRDSLATAGLAQVKLLSRLQGKTIDQIRNGAGAAPEDMPAQLLVADLDLSGGHVDDAFDRLLSLYPRVDAEDKETIRARLLELFEVAGAEDPRVIAARRRLTMLLY